LARNRARSGIALAYSGVEHLTIPISYRHERTKGPKVKTSRDQKLARCDDTHIPESRWKMSRIASNDKICTRLNGALHYFVVVGVLRNLKPFSRYNYWRRTFIASHGIRGLREVQSELSSSENFPAFLKKRLGAEASETPRDG
jgi:hypothetical protein